MNSDDLTALSLKPKASFIDTPFVHNLTERAFLLPPGRVSGSPRGPARTGKTTMAMHMAAQLNRPVVLIHGDDEFGSSDLIGGQLGYHKYQGHR